MNEQLRSLIFAGLAFALGMGVGQFVSFRRTGRKTIVVEIEAREVWEKIIKEVAWIVVIVVFLASIAQSVIFTYDQRKCNQRVIDTISYRAGLTTQVQQLSDARQAALSDLLTALLDSSKKPNPQQANRDAVAAYQDINAKLNADEAKANQQKLDATFPGCAS